MAIVFVGMVSAAQSSFAQQPMKDNKTPEQRAEAQTKSVTKALNLTADQQKTIYAANLKATQDMQAMQSAGQFDRNKMKTIQDEKDAAYKNTLTADQYKQYEQYKQQMREKMMQRRQEQQQAPDMNQAGQQTN